MAGGGGDDLYIVNSAGDMVSEAAGQGSDTVRSSVSYALGSEVELLVLTGGGATSGTGNAVINVISGGSGANTLDGDGGRDTLTGAGGADAFVYSTAIAGTNADTVADFSRTQGDHIDLDSAIFTALPLGALAGSQFVKGAGATAALDGDDRLIYNTTDGKLYYDADGAGGSAAKLIFTLAGHPALAAGDIHVI
jgi:Ca2+-binding RTX toxin-like protein